MGIAERTIFGVVTDLTGAGHVAKQKDGRRDRHQIHAHLLVLEPTGGERSIGDVLAVLSMDSGDSGTRE